MPYPFITNLILYQGAWFSALFLAPYSAWVILPLLLVMFGLSQDRQGDLSLMAKTLPIALLTEGVLVLAEVVDYQVGYLIPIWLVLLWASLIMTLPLALKPLIKLPLPWFMLLCVVGAPLTYYAGIKNEVLSMASSPTWYWLSFGVIWTTGFTAIRHIALQHLEQRTCTESSS